MKKVFFAMVMLLLVVVTTGCGGRLQNAKIDNVITDFSNDEDDKIVTESTSNLETVELNMQDYQVPVNVPEFITELEEEPDWWSIDNLEAFCSTYTMKIPKAITSLYVHHKEKGCLNEFGEIEFWGTDENYAHYASIFDVYQEEDGTYRITEGFSTYNAEEVIWQGCFRNSGDLIIISLLKYESDQYYHEHIKIYRQIIRNEGYCSLYTFEVEDWR